MCVCVCVCVVCERESVREGGRERERECVSLYAFLYFKGEGYSGLYSASISLAFAPKNRYVRT